MKKKNILRVVALSALLAGNLTVKAAEGDKLSYEIRNLLASPQGVTHRAATDGKVCVFVKLKEGMDESLLAQYGCETLTRIGAVYIANVPLGQLPQLAADERVVRIETHTGGQHLLDVTPQWVKSTPVYEGLALPKAFTGQGVLLGIIDGGIDVSHPTFYNADGTKYRIKRFVDDFYSADETAGTLTDFGREYTTEKDILAKARSGDINETHGTHCASIAAGSGYNTPYRGIAYNADIFPISSRVAMSEISAPSEVLRMKHIFDYAEQQKQPCVINYSIGFHAIPDDAELFSEALKDVQGAGKILVVAAGNNNDYPTYISKPEGMAAAGGAIMPRGDKKTIYAISEKPFKMKFFITKEDAKTNVITKCDSIVFDSENLRADTTVRAGFHVIMKRSGTFYTLFVRTEKKELNGISETPLLCVEGADAAVRVYCSPYVYFFNVNPAALPGDSRFASAERSHNLSLPGCLSEVLTVGALVGRSSYVNIKGETKVEEGAVEGQIASFSSVGPTLDGLTKPDVVAPGVNIIAAGNSYCKAAFGAELVKETTFNGRPYPWVSFSGTSMAGPCVAGIVALWLEADPKLTPKEVKEIVKATSHQVEEGMQSPNNTYGYGLIDAYAGMLKVLGIETAIRDVSTHQPSALTIRPQAGGAVQLSFNTAPQQSFRVRVYTVAGRLLAEQTLQPGQSDYTLDIAQPLQGICVVQVDGTEQGVTGSELIRF